MSLLFKAELHGHKEPMAQAAFVMEDLKKGLSEEIMNLFRRKRINIGDIDELPILTVNSKTGSGAVLKANIDVRPETPQGEIKQVIDCINT